jgi:hypothetical protein
LEITCFSILYSGSWLEVTDHRDDTGLNACAAEGRRA